MAVYFIQDEDGPIKIGYSEGNPYRRLNAFCTGNPRELKLLVSIPGGREEEQALHERFADLRVKGEWFRPDARLLGFIEAMQYTYRDKQPEPVEENDLFGLSATQLRACAGYVIAAEAMMLSGAYSDVQGDERAELYPVRKYLSSRLKYIRQLSTSDMPVGDGVRALLREVGANPTELINALLANSTAGVKH